METKGLEPSTSALRTHETRVLSEEETEVTTAASGASANASPKRRKNDLESAPNPPAESDFAAAIQMIASLPLSDAEKAEAVRRLLAGRDG
jgi:hypothetical protein